MDFGWPIDDQLQALVLPIELADFEVAMAWRSVMTKG